jgi:hypothetical protein
VSKSAPTPTIEELRARPEAATTPNNLKHGLTVREVARRYRVSTDRVRAWIKRGEMIALNTADVRSRKPQFVVMPEALERFERGRVATAPPAPPKRKRQPSRVNFFPEL